MCTRCAIPSTWLKSIQNHSVCAADRGPAVNDETIAATLQNLAAYFLVFRYNVWPRQLISPVVKGFNASFTIVGVRGSDLGFEFLRAFATSCRKRLS